MYTVFWGGGFIQKYCLQSFILKVNSKYESSIIDLFIRVDILRGSGPLVSCD